MDYREELKPLVNGPNWHLVVRFIESVLENEQIRLASLDNTVEIYRCQGRIYTLNTIKNLKETINRKD